MTKKIESKKEEKFISRTGETVNKPWGWEYIIEHNEHYTMKILHINEGHRMSLQYHEEKTETVYVLKGSLVNYTSEDDNIKHIYMSGTFLHINAGDIHRFGAYNGECEIMECSRSMLDDVVRLADDYQREK